MDGVQPLMPARANDQLTYGPLDRPSLPDDSLLQQYDLRIDPLLRIIHCLQCEEAIQPSSARGHVLTHLPSCLPVTQLGAIFEAHRVDGTVLIPPAPIAPIPGLKHIQGFKCRECGHLAASDRSMRTHYQSKHPQHPYMTPYQASVHKIYEFRGDTVLIETDATLVDTLSGTAYESYRAIVPVHPRAPKVTFQHPEDPKDLDGFLYATKWHESITGCNIASIRALATFPDGRGPGDNKLDFVVRAMEKYLGMTLDGLFIIPTLVLRLVNTPNQ
jgi:Orsellinic acid/F9775 biosynthesis cluster protein D